ncbi:MAG: dihydrodipicolinate synthase family protein [Cetobacterium sp.]|uniref:dihydrodipicolinate synthase family protein n=1 Tax=Cetobacterium sp. TaxID=2071632 RepID=UPI003EE484BC
MKKAKYLTPVITAFNKEREIDIKGNKEIWEHLINGGVDGIVLLGSTGEFFNMSMLQKKELIKIAIEHINKRIPLFVGTGSMNIEETIELSNYALNLGADGVMIIGPYYFPVNDRDLENFYSKLAININGDIYLYNFPKMTGHDINPKVLLNLLEKHQNIIGYKDTVSEMSHTRNLIQAIKDKYPNFIIYSGYDDNFVHNILSGGNGCIGALSNLYPQIFKQWVDAINNKDIINIEKFQKLIDSVMEIYDVETPFIPVLKKALILNGIKIEEYCTEPFGVISEIQVSKLKKILEKIK